MTQPKIAALRPSVRNPRRAGLLLAALTVGVLTGCAVPQPRGLGSLTREVEPTTKRGYWRYLPRDYVKADESARSARRWPLVVSFHGMKPFDNARPQALEWEAEADRYGYIVIAPELRAPDVLAQFPVETVSSSFKSDETATLAILDHLFATTAADSQNVLSTSWSSGGYMAHYMMNRHPDRFTCVAARQSNFSGSILDAGLTQRSQGHPVLIINTENDFAICMEESRKARGWYSSHGYRNLAWIVIRSLGHERTPDMAADFFGMVAGVQPSGATTVLAQRQTIDGNESGIAFLSGKMGGMRPTTVASATAVNSGAANIPQPSAATPPRPAPQAPKPAEPNRPKFETNVRPAPAVVSSTPSSEPQVQVRGLPRKEPTPPAPAAPAPEAASIAQPRADAVPARNVPRRDPLSIRVSSAIGVEPLHLNYSAECPADWYESASFLWTLNGDSLSSTVNGQKTISSPGEHTLGLLVVTRDGSEHRVTRTVRVIPRLNAASTGTSKTAGTN